jgi:hypothetical protein
MAVEHPVDATYPASPGRSSPFASAHAIVSHATASACRMSASRRTKTAGSLRFLRPGAPVDPTFRSLEFRICLFNVRNSFGFLRGQVRQMQRRKRKTGEELSLRRDSNCRARHHGGAGPVGDPPSRRRGASAKTTTVHRAYCCALSIYTHNKGYAQHDYNQ